MVLGNCHLHCCFVMVMFKNNNKSLLKIVLIFSVKKNQFYLSNYLLMVYRNLTTESL